MKDELEAPRAARFDFSGFLRLSVFMVSASLALDGLSDLGFTKATSMILAVFAMASLVSYVLHANREPNALFSLELFRVRTYSIGLAGNLFARLGSSGVPFLIPLFFQLTLNYSPLEAGLMMIPIAAAGIVVKRFATAWIERLGYRNVLVVNTFIVGGMIASFCFITAEEPSWLRILQLAFFGMVNSLQFTSMNTITLKDLEKNRTASGNSLFSMVQMLAMSFAVAIAGVLLNSFMQRYNGATDPAQALRAFHATFICMGLFTCTSAWIFWQLSPDGQCNKKPPEQMEVL